MAQRLQPVGHRNQLSAVIARQRICAFVRIERISLHIGGRGVPGDGYHSGLPCLGDAHVAAFARHIDSDVCLHINALPGSVAVVGGESPGICIRSHWDVVGERKRSTHRNVVKGLDELAVPLHLYAVYVLQLRTSYGEGGRAEAYVGVFPAVAVCLDSYV